MIDATAQIQASGKQITDRRRPRRGKLFIFQVEGCNCFGVCGGDAKKYSGSNQCAGSSMNAIS
jgi:hypothetical protein